MSSNNRIMMIVTVIVALAMSLIPWPAWIDPFAPDWVLLALIYWAMLKPEVYSVGTAWVAGLFVDVAQGSLLGQHALAMTLVIFVVVKLHLRLRVFPIPQLTLTVMVLLGTYQFLLFWINGIAGVSAPGSAYWAPVLGGTLLWPVLSMFLNGLRLRARS